MKTLKELCSCGRPWVERRATQAIALKQAFDAKEISQDEYQELLEDLVRTDQLESEADDIEFKTMLVTGIYALTKVI
jgi:hypothetical protein